MRRQLRRVAAKVPLGLFRGLDISLRHRVALYLFAFGFATLGGRMLFRHEQKFDE
jgi:hypothetical protein